MAQINSKDEFKAYCLRRLGSPVINIEVSPDQIDDRVDDAIDYWIRNHMDGSERTFYVHSLTVDDINAREVTLPDSIFEVHGIVPISNITTGGMYSIQYQEVLNAFIHRVPMDTVSYFVRVVHWELINRLFSEGHTVSFSKYLNRVRLDMSASNLFVEGSKLILDVQKAISPEENPAAWNDEILKRYATAQIKRQWGENLKKHSQVMLPGNVTVNGEAIYQEAVQEIADIEGEMRERYSLPPMFLTG